MTLTSRHTLASNARLSVITVLLVLLAVPLYAGEDIDAEEPIPTSVEEIISPMDRLAEPKPIRPGFFPWLKVKLLDYPPFLRDTKLNLNLRSFYYNRDKYDESVSESWAVGGALTYSSGWLYDAVSLGAALYTSQPAYGPDGREGAGLLAPGQKGYTVLGQLYGRVKLADETFLNLYRYGEYNTPYLSKNDSKMTPYTFEGYTLAGRLGGGEGAPRLDYGGGYLLKIKDKTAETFTWMSEKAGSKEKRGVAALGARYTQDGFSLAAMNYYCDDVINIAYAEASYLLKISKEFGVRLAGQFTDERSVGSNLLNGHYFATNQAGVKADVSYGGAMLTLAYTAVGHGADMINPWSGYPGYTSSMIIDFKKAGTQALSTKLSYDFSRVGVPDVTGYASFIHGWGMVTPGTNNSQPNDNEVDTDLQWRPKGEYLTGLWVRLRYGVAYQYEGPKQFAHDGRVIINYDFQLM
jgi:hypothetical protein